MSALTPLTGFLVTPYFIACLRNNFRDMRRTTMLICAYKSKIGRHYMSPYTSTIIFSKNTYADFH